MQEGTEKRLKKVFYQYRVPRDAYEKENTNGVSYK